VGVTVVTAAFLMLTVIDLGGRGPTPLNPIATAAERTAGYAGVRTSIRATADYPEVAARLTMSGNGAYNGRTERSRFEITGHIEGGPPGVPEIEMVGVSEGLTDYLSSPLLTPALPDGKTWMKVSLGEEFEQSSLAQTDPSRQLDALRAVSDGFRTVGPESVRDVLTTHYTATLDFGRYADILRDEGLDEAAEQVEAEAELIGDVPVSVWIDKGERVRRFDMTLPMESPGMPRTELAMSFEMYDFGVHPRIDLPPADAVVDATELTEQHLDAVTQ
jgi:hypothetical protein